MTITADLASSFHGLTCDGVLAAMAHLGHIGAVAIHAVEDVLVVGEASAAQGLAAGDAHETLFVPGVLLVGDPAGGDGLRRKRGTVITSHQSAM